MRARCARLGGARHAGRRRLGPAETVAVRGAAQAGEGAAVG
ncbi:hypothetical protein STTU_1175 [Streptomyces sp. Tu6071]|nr:hypothetical protein STTU_1175 [Streptomyces sp. Tu6071]